MLSRRQLRLLHAARRKLRLDDDTYRAILRQHGGVESSKDLDAAGFDRVVRYFRERGFNKVPGRSAFTDRPGFATPAQLDYVCSLWRQAATRAEKRSLGRWLERTCGVSDVRFLTPEMARDAIEGLKAMAARKAAAGAQGGKTDPSPAA
jgi:hypothetical protein